MHSNKGSCWAMQSDRLSGTVQLPAAASGAAFTASNNTSCDAQRLGWINAQCVCPPAAHVQEYRLSR
jgi:hypothetical protein